MDKKLERLIDDLFESSDKVKSEFKIYKSGNNIAVHIANLDLSEIEELSVNAIGRILDLFPEENRQIMIKLAKTTCKTKCGLLFEEDD